jgi:hypothetical protein
MNPIDPATPMAVTLTAAEWNSVIVLLNETGPYRIVRPLIANITEQVESAAVSQAPAHANGADSHVSN